MATVTTVMICSAGWADITPLACLTAAACSAADAGEALERFCRSEDLQTITSGPARANLQTAAGLAHRGEGGARMVQARKSARKALTQDKTEASARSCAAMIGEPSH